MRSHSFPACVAGGLGFYSRQQQSARTYDYHLRHHLPGGGADLHAVQRGRRTFASADMMPRRHGAAATRRPGADAATRSGHFHFQPHGPGVFRHGVRRVRPDFQPDRRHQPASGSARRFRSSAAWRWPSVVLWLFNAVFRHTQSSSESHVASLIGQTAVIVTPIPENGVGEIAYVAGRHALHRAGACGKRAAPSPPARPSKSPASSEPSFTSSNQLI